MNLRNAPAATADAADAAPPGGQAATGRSLPWPAPALLTWLAAWGLQLAGAGVSPAGACLAATGFGLAVALASHRASRSRRLIIGLGFPVSVLLTIWSAGPTDAPAAVVVALPLALAPIGVASGLPAWAWLLPALLLLGIYPLRAWRDAPLFPTPSDALRGLSGLAPLPAGARVLDAGCGLGHGLAALHAEYGAARIEGVEWSWPLRAACALRCPWARVRQADMWQSDWSGLALVYLFQRPESMARALAKAQAEMAPGSWLASLEFVAAGAEPTASLQRPGARPVWLYQVQPAARAGGAKPVSRVGPKVRPQPVNAQPAAALADNPLNKSASSVRQP